MKSLFLFISCVFCLVIAAYLGHQLLTGQFSATEGVSEPIEAFVTVPIAKKAVFAGDVLYPADVNWVDRPASDVKYTALKRENFTTPDQYFAVSQGIKGGGLIEMDVILWPSQLNFLPSILKKNYRAMAVQFRKDNLIVPMLWPGSRIDLMLSLDPEKKSLFSNRAAVKLISSNVRVLSNSSIIQGNEKGTARLAQQGAFSLILEVTPKQSETISLARKIGSLLPVLRSNGEQEIASIPKENTLIEDITKLVPFSILSTKIEHNLEIPQKIFIQRGAEVTTIIRDMPEISHGHGTDINAEREL